MTRKNISLLLLTIQINIVTYTNLRTVRFIEILNIYNNYHYPGRQTGGGWGGLNPPEFWMRGLNTCQPP